MAPEYGPNTPVLAPERAAYRGSQLWLLWPALQYRVVAPVVHDQRLNPFQRAVLALCRSGMRESEDVAGELGLDVELIALVRSELVQLAYLDEHGAVSPRGQQALADGFLDPTSTTVTHVYQDPFTGRLWPAARPRLLSLRAAWDGSPRVRLHLGSTGERQNRSALPVRSADVRPDPPRPDEIIEAVSRAEAARRRSRGREGPWWEGPPHRLLDRVSMVSSGEPVYLPVTLVVVGQSVPDDEAEEHHGEARTWLAFSPFTGHSSAWLRWLVATRVERLRPLAVAVEKLLGRASTGLLEDHDRLTTARQRQIQEDLERLFTLRIREHKHLKELLIVIEFYLGSAEVGDRQMGELANVLRSAWQVHEVVLRQVLRDHPMRPDDRSRALPSALGRACQEIGLAYGQRRAAGRTEWIDIDAAFKDPGRARRPALLTAAVLSAAAGDANHPVRRLARSRPDLLTLLRQLSDERNEVSHEQLVPLNLELARLGRELAHEAVAAYLGLPPPPASHMEGN
jgi:hypothetical protein